MMQCVILSLLGISKIKNRQRCIEEEKSDLSHRNVKIESDQEVQLAKEIPDFCPNCGTRLNKRSAVQYCPYCGIILSKINRITT